MSKNISIKQVHTTKSFSNVAKIRTNLYGGGSCTWVPEDEVALIEKVITANGTYKASDDSSYGYSDILVALSIGKRGFQKNGTYNASTYNVDGWSEIDIDVPDKVSGKDSQGKAYVISKNEIGDMILTNSDGVFEFIVSKDPQTGNPVISLGTIS